MFAGLAREQEVAHVVGTAHVPSNSNIQEHIGREGSSMIRTSYTSSAPQAGGTPLHDMS